MEVQQKKNRKKGQKKQAQKSENPKARD